MCRKMAARNSSHETSSRTPLRLASIALAVVGCTLAMMAGGLPGVVAVVLTVLSVDLLLGASDAGGRVITGRWRNGEE